MTDTRRSYDTGRESSGAEQELKRLRAQLDLSWEAELRHLRMLGIGDRGAMLDVGCGPGYLLERWHQAFPTTELVGLDNDSGLLDRARMGPMGGKAEWVEADSSATGLDADRFETVLSRFVWQHLADPGAAAAEALRVLRPGGRLCVVDVDAELWGIAQPVFPEVIPIHIRAGQAQVGRGGDRRVGRKLWRLLTDAGFTDVHTDLVAVHTDAQGMAPFVPQLDPDRQRVAVRDGVLTEADLDVLRSAQRRFMDAPDCFVMMVLCLASGTKPTP
jgi:SAM-dependent methyltransferase